MDKDYNFTALVYMLKYIKLKNIVSENIVDREREREKETERGRERETEKST